jgi:predicted RNA-binding protein associated with RNAse of E/G family
MGYAMEDELGEPVIIHKLDEKGIEVWRYEGIVLSKNASSLTLRAIFDRDDMAFEGLLLKRGDSFIETFFSDRWYNIFKIYDVLDGHLKGWYCNVCRPARIETGHVYADDLALDLIVYPDGGWRILDEDEFRQLEISAEDQKNAKGALDQLIDLARQRKAPFESHRD